MKVCMVYAISQHVILESWLVSNSPLGLMAVSAADRQTPAHMCFI